MDVPRSAEPLYALPPSRFTGERNALAKELAEKGDPSAGAVRKLPRPVGLAWVLNRLARERRADVEALVAAGERLRAGQRRALSGRGAEELRAAEDELRTRARALRAEAERILAAEGKAPPPPVLARVELLLRVTAPLPGPSRDALRRGVLAREPEVAAGELAGFAVLPGGRGAPSRPNRAPDAPGAARRGDGRAAKAREERERREAQRSAAREERVRRERERLALRARREADAALRLAEREERTAAEAAERAQRARQRASDAREEANRLRARVQELERSV